MERLFLLKFAAYDRSDIETNENIFPVEILLYRNIAEYPLGTGTREFLSFPIRTASKTHTSRSSISSIRILKYTFRTCFSFKTPLKLQQATVAWKANKSHWIILDLCSPCLVLAGSLFVNSQFSCSFFFFFFITLYPFLSILFVIRLMRNAYPPSRDTCPEKAYNL